VNKSAITKKCNNVAFAILYLLYILNDRIIKNRKIELLIWNLIKWELFYIGGQCNHSGNCCKNIMLFWSDRAIMTSDKFEEAKQKSSQYTNFVPTYSSRRKIDYFNCKCLSQEKKCLQYKTRPNWCRTYPTNYFHVHDHVLGDCGYQVYCKRVPNLIGNRQLKKRIKTVLNLNQIESFNGARL